MNSVLTLIGGFGLFLFGMKFMSDGLEKTAGVKLRNVLDIMTKNKVIGTFVGIIFTAIIQSSSATTIMVVSFVNAGLMNLMQAAGVIMGANIGTTITSQLVAFDFWRISPLFIFIGVILRMVSKKAMLKKVGEVITGFGILFFGLQIMSEGIMHYQNNARVIELLSSFQNPLLAIVIGILLTAALQGSSVSVSVILIMATQGMLELSSSLFMILGCNIGSSVTPLVASIGAKKSAKRAALIHLVLNVIGALIISSILIVGMSQVIEALQRVSGDNTGRVVANAHTFFRIFQVLIIFPFVNQIVLLTYKIIPGEDKDVNQFELKYIGKDAVFSPSTAIVEAEQELVRMGELAVDNLSRGITCLITQSEKDIQQVYSQEEDIDYINQEVIKYLVKVNQMTLPVSDANRLGAIFHVVNDIERIGDFAENFADAAKMTIQDELELSKKSQKEICDMLEIVIEMIHYSLEIFLKKDDGNLKKLLSLENQIDTMEKELQKSHIQRLSKGKCTPEESMIFIDVASGLERVADHAINIAFSIKKENII